ncbi:hypothetical protein KSD_40030 [Ktedonobacter sp. SOSP1-85]|nr:hypothetical protein KSD_40030 [Ktedonobacter sp. SOSP1-85]
MSIGFIMIAKRLPNGHLLAIVAKRNGKRRRELEQRALAGTSHGLQTILCSQFAQNARDMLFGGAQ